MSKPVTRQFVHALDSFRAFQEGQVSLSANETMLLLSADHYYWWYVQSMETLEMGYVPALLLELPNERLARHNCDINVEALKPFPGSASGPCEQEQSDAYEEAERPARKRSVRFSEHRVEWASDADSDYDDYSYDGQLEYVSYQDAHVHEMQPRIESQHAYIAATAPELVNDDSYEWSDEQDSPMASITDRSEAFVSQRTMEPLYHDQNDKLPPNVLVNLHRMREIRRKIDLLVESH